MCDNIIDNLETLYNKLNIEYKNYDNFIYLTTLVKNYKGDDWINYIKYDDNKYNRIRLDNFSNSKFEMYIICWKSQQASKIHDHSINGCIMKILHGSLKEKIYDCNLQLKNELIINKNYISFIKNDIGLHKIEALDYSVSLHIYSPPNYISNTYL